MNASRDRLLIVGTATGAFGGMLAATLAGLSCCIPTIVAIVGVSGAVALDGLTAYRLPMLGASVLLLAFGFWRTYRPQPACAEGNCAPRAGRMVRVMLWGAAGMTVVNALLPYAVRALYDRGMLS